MVKWRDWPKKEPVSLARIEVNLLVMVSVYQKGTCNIEKILVKGNVWRYFVLDIFNR